MSLCVGLSLRLGRKPASQPPSLPAGPFGIATVGATDSAGRGAAGRGAAGGRWMAGMAMVAGEAIKTGTSGGLGGCGRCQATTKPVTASTPIKPHATVRVSNRRPRVASLSRTGSGRGAVLRLRGLAGGPSPVPLPKGETAAFLTVLMTDFFVRGGLANLRLPKDSVNQV